MQLEFSGSVLTYLSLCSAQGKESVAGVVQIGMNLNKLNLGLRKTWPESYSKNTMLSKRVKEYTLYSSSCVQSQPRRAWSLPADP